MRRGFAFSSARAAPAAERGRRKSCCPERNDAKRGVAAHHSLQHIVRGAVASAGKDSVVTFGNCLACLLARFCLSARRLGSGFDSGVTQHSQGCLNVCQPPLSARAGERVVEEKGLAHQD